MRPIATFSIVARDPATGDLGVATASKFLAVGSVVPYAKADVAAIATQSYANTTYGPRAVQALEAGIPLAQIHDAFVATDPDHALRQYGIVTAAGDAISVTGDACHPWAGGRSGDGWAAQGNLLTGPEVIDAVADTFTRTPGELPERLMAALTAGDQAGGDARGRQGAALYVVRKEGGYGGFNDVWVDLRVDDDPDPVTRLADLLRLQRLFAGPAREEDLLDLTGDVAARTLEGLWRAGRLPETHQAWDDAAEAALRNWAGVVNVEDRMVDPGRIDRVVLEYLEEITGEAK